MRVLLVLAVLCVAAVHCNDVTCEWEECDAECDGGLRLCTRTNGKKWWHNCHVQSCELVDGCGKADIVFVFDSSASIGEKNYWVLKQFGIDIVKGLTIGTNESRIGLVTYSDHATTRWGFNEYLEAEPLEEAFWSVPWEAGITNTQDGLEHARVLIENEARADVKHLVIVITDGESNVKKDETVPKAEEMHGKGIEIFTIGIGAINEEECRGIASELKEFHFHYVVNYNALVAITNTVINDTCTASSLMNCGDWTVYGPCQVFDQDKGCGMGQRERSRICMFYLWPGGPVADERIAYEGLECEIPCTAEPPVCKDDCAQNQCSLNPTDDNCEKFSKCVRMCECMLGDEVDP